MKRFYTQATIDAGTLCLDGKPVRTPKGLFLTTTYAPLAEALAKEWNAQGPNIDRESMPLTQILTTSLDMEPDGRADLEEHLLGWVDTDLLCYRIDAPPDLVRRQQIDRDPLLKEIEARMGLHLTTTTGLQAITQPPEVHAALKSCMSDMDSLRFTCFQVAATASGSPLLALALTEGWADARTVLSAIEMEETYHAAVAREDLYGMDPHRKRTSEALHRDLEAIAIISGFIGKQKTDQDP